MAVLASGLLEPLPPVTHEVAEKSCPAIKGRRQKCQVSGRLGGQVLTAGSGTDLVEQVAKDIGPRIVIGAVSLVKIGNVENGVLEDSRSIAHADDMVQLQGGKF